MLRAVEVKRVALIMALFTWEKIPGTLMVEGTSGVDLPLVNRFLAIQFQNMDFISRMH
jgi:hypothetical protein